MRSATLAPNYDADAPVVAVYGAVRGLRLLASASGILTAPTRCQEVLRNLLATSTVDKRTDDLLLGAAAGMADDVKHPRLQRDVDALPDVTPAADLLEHGLPPTYVDQVNGYAVQGLHALQAVQDQALQLYRTKTAQLPFGLDVLLVQPFHDSGMWQSGRLVDALASEEGFDANFTPPVKRKMRELGGQFDRVRSMRVADDIKTFDWRNPRIIIQNASLFPLRQFSLPSDPFHSIRGPPEVSHQALVEHQRANAARRPAGWERMTPAVGR